MSGAPPGESSDPTHAGDPSIESACVGWLDWGIRLASELHRLPQNASRRQRRLLTALCARLRADAGSTTIFAGTTTRPDAAPLAADATGVGVAVTPALRRVYFVGHDLAAPSAVHAPRTPGTINFPAAEEPTDTESRPPHISHGPGHDPGHGPGPRDVVKRLHAMPATWSARDGAEAVAFSLVRLAEDRVSLLELRRRGTDAAAPIAFDDGTLAALATVHGGCAWACDASPMLGMTSVPGLSPRERETLEHLLAGASEKEVAALLKRSPHTVHSYIKRIYRQLGVRSRAELLAIFVDAGGRT